jgi:hypothetical protein
VLVSGLLAGSYLTVLFVLGQTFGGLTGRPQSVVVVVVATLVAVSVTAPRSV